MKSCHACAKQLDIGREIGRRDECPFCHADLHCCLNCRFYETAAARQCREPQAELVREKAKANFCGFFIFSEAAPEDAKGGADQARTALDNLFRK